VVSTGEARETDETENAIYRVYHVWREGMSNYAENVDQRDALRSDRRR
jgi:hypothetical protein